MRKYTVEKISEYLSLNKFIFQVEECGRLIKVFRDSIANKYDDVFGEEEKYNMLLLELGKEFSYRFFYSCKNDDYLWLETVCGE
jgi:hypothetical protein